MMNSSDLSAQTSPLVELLFDLPEVELRSLAQEHGLGGLLSRFQSQFRDELTKNDFLKTRQQLLQKNILFLDEFKKINAESARKFGFGFTPLKGLSLLQTIHELGERPLTDMDLYTRLTEKQFTEFFTSFGYQVVSEKKWFYNHHKWVFSKKTPLLDFTVEVHTQLLPQDKHHTWSLDKDARLAKDEEFLYLCAHWAQQHTCLKLFWLFDLHLYCQKNPEVWTKNLWKKANELKITQSLLAAFWALHLNFNGSYLPKTPPQGSALLPLLMRPESLLYLHKNRVKYLLLKHLLKDSLIDSISYDLQWTQFQLEKSVSKFKSTFAKDL